MSVKLPNLIPPFRFTIVEENLFRGGYPKPRNKRFLKRLKLKTVLSLIPDKLLPEMQEFFEQQSIQLLQLNVDKMKEDNIPLTYNKTIMALQLLIDPANHPLYIHCLDGADVTGLVIACLRKIQMWNNTSAMSEFARHLHTNVISSEEFEFIENFRNFEITIPMHLPTWLWGGQVNFRKHPSLRLKFLNSDMMTEEERELKELKEKKEKEKEDYYKRRKNDLLDNLFDPNAPGSRHRAASGSNNNNNSNNNSSNNNSINNSNNNNNNSNSNSSNSNSNNNNSNNANINNIPSIQSTLNIVNGTNPSSLVDTDMSIPLAENTKQSVEDAKDPYLVDVDVDVDGVMMDGLDQVEYMNRGGGNTLNGRFYAEDDESGMLMDEDGDLYNDQGSRYISEPISRTLEALALEGLTEF